MNEVNVLLANDPKFKFVEVTFDNLNSKAKRYTYKTTFELQEGDVVLVDSPSEGLTAVTVVALKSILELDHTKNYRYKWVVQKVDTTAYDAAVALENAVQAKVNQAKAKLEMKRLQAALTESMTEQDAKELKKLVCL